jgi:hypothetical protein
MLRTIAQHWHTAARPARYVRRVKTSLPGSSAIVRVSLALVCAATAGGACSLPINGLGLFDPVGPPEGGATDDAWASGSQHPSESGAAVPEGGVTGEEPVLDAAAQVDSTGDAVDGSAADSSSGLPDAGTAADSGSIIAPGGPSLCTTAGFLFCDGFEGTLSAWVIDTSGGEASIDTTRAFRGTHSLHAHTDALTGGSMPFQKAYVDHLQTLPQTLFARAFLYIPSPYGSQSAAGVLNVFEPIPPYAGAEIDLLPNTNRLAYNGFNDPSLNGNIASSAALTLDAWHCLEMEIDGAGRAFHAYLDNVELADLAHDLAGTAPILGALQVGLGFSQASAQAAADLWVDEVAVNGSRIGCH